MVKQGAEGHSAAAGDAGEVSMSIEETNKLRASLGLAPLKMDADKPKGPSEAEKKRKREEEDAAKAEELEERVRQARERRRQQELLSSTKTLGEADNDVDDVMAWVTKSRKQPTKQAQAKSKPNAGAKPGGDDSEGEAHGAAALAGAKVKVGLDDLEDGEEMILTLEDQSILDDKGRVIEDDALVLENVLAVSELHFPLQQQKEMHCFPVFIQLASIKGLCTRTDAHSFPRFPLWYVQREVKDRSKAYKESRKSAKPLWEEDGVSRSILDKYDEEEEEALQLNDAGALEAEKLRRQEDVRAKLAAAAAASGPVAGAAPAGAGPNGDYFTPEEMEAMKKPKKKRERKLKKKALTADELEALEVEAAAKGGSEDLGSRADRERRAAQRKEEEAAQQAEKRARFDAALSKANYASLALRASGNGAGAEDEDEQEDDLYKSLSKARELALRTREQAARPESLAEQIARRRANGVTTVPADLEEGGLTFTDIGEFARNITVNEAEAAMGEDGVGNADAGAAAAVEMEGLSGTAAVNPEEPEGEAPAEPAEPMEEGKNEPGFEGAGAWGSWMTASEADAAEGAAASKRKNHRRRKAEGDDDAATAEAAAAVGGEKAIGTGLAGALAFLKERGDLQRPVEWAGRTNDSRDSYFTAAMGGYKDVFTGGRSEDKLALDVEVALTRKDEYGRVLAPKEAFRQLCHQFHGIRPSLNTREKRAKQVAKEMAQRKTATGSADGQVMAGLKAVQAEAATPYMVLSGQVKPGQSRDAASGYATVDRAEAIAKQQGGKRSMPPPPPKAKKG